MDARIALHALKAWARARIAIRQPVLLVTSFCSVEYWSPTPGSATTWRCSTDTWYQNDRISDRALAAIDNAIAIAVLDPTGYRAP